MCSWEWQSRPSFHLRDTYQRISEVMSWYESHVGDLTTELQSGNVEAIHDALQPIPTCECSLLKTQLKAAASAPVCQPFLRDHQRGGTAELFCHCHQLAHAFVSHQWHPHPPDSREVGGIFLSRQASDHVCFSSSADQFNFTLQTSASCVRQKSKRATSLIHGVWDRLPEGQSTDE